MTPERMAEIRAAVEAITPLHESALPWVKLGWSNEAVDFFRHSPTYVTELLGEVDRLPALVDVAEAAQEALSEAQGALDNAKDSDETETYCYGNLVHVARGLRVALARLESL